MVKMAHVKIELDFKQYLHEKAQQSRQNEIQACLMFLAGDLFFVGGILTNLVLPGNVEWFLFFPYHPSLNAGPVLGLSLIISGLCLMISGIVIGLHYYSDRRWYIEELQKTYENELRKINPKEEPQTTQKKHTKKEESNKPEK